MCEYCIESVPSRNLEQQAALDAQMERLRKLYAEDLAKIPRKPDGDFDVPILRMGSKPLKRPFFARWLFT